MGLDYIRAQTKDGDSALEKWPWTAFRSRPVDDSGQGRKARQRANLGLA